MANLAFIQELIDLTNQFRVNNGLHALYFDPILTKAAQFHSENMAFLDFFSHTGVNGSRPLDRALEAGYESSFVGENIAAGYRSPQAVFDGWINSPGHRNNILNSSYNEIGIGYFHLENDTGSINYGRYWTQVFGRGIPNQPFSSINTTNYSIDPLRYGASHPDLIQAFGANSLALLQHYHISGKNEGRRPDIFSGDRYLASHGDLIRAFGYNIAAANQHYIQSGYYEGRSAVSFDPTRYLASHDDLIGAFGYNSTAATQHYVQSGYYEGRSTVSFDPAQYLASHDDLIGVFGYNLTVATQHYVQSGYYEGRARDTFDEARYLASHSDLISVFGYNLNAATQHYIMAGKAENRSPHIFDAVTYLNNYTDLQAAFGSNLAAATRHYIEVGYHEGRTFHGIQQDPMLVDEMNLSIPGVGSIAPPTLLPVF